jgi:hypothetical protein
MDYPFEQIVKDNKIIRTFTPDIENDELKWHQDLNDRKVIVIEGGGWKFQMDESLPINLSNKDEFFIPKLNWHRVIKGDGKLVVEIVELI